ncbi:MAG: LLM class flavin-dependent oxidoreductase [Candidatus Binatia bacterium]|nr:LLM class flavin-dependent oxidoreductase [Candidatus Binatia bacterium]
MEFGIFIQGTCTGENAHIPEKEHEALFNEIAYTKTADKNNWKYCWATEHHGLTEYSHISANDVYLGYLAAQTERIHLGSGIFNLSPRVNHPVRNAEKVAMLDHLTQGRFEFGTGRGAGSHEIATFNIHDTSSTKVEWDEVIKEIPKMWRQKDYTFQGDHFQMDTPHNILPKPYKAAHPAMWVACGNPKTYEKAGKMGIGALGFNFSPVAAMKPQIDSYKEGAANCTDPVGDYQNNNVMVTNSVICMKDRDHAREIACRPDRGLIFSLVCLYHDTFPTPPGAPVWPETPNQMKIEDVDAAIEAGALLCGNPEEVAEQLKAFDAVGMDQLVFGMPNHLKPDEVHECLELFGQKVIPEYDKDPVCSTTHYRNNATGGGF